MFNTLTAGNTSMPSKLGVETIQNRNHKTKYPLDRGTGTLVPSVWSFLDIPKAPEESICATCPLVLHAFAIRELVKGTEANTKANFPDGTSPPDTGFHPSSV